jgi:hypothetical protein
MASLLPDYNPPNHQRASLAVGLAPLLVLMTFTMVVIRWMDPSTGMGAFAACTTWVIYEMHVYQAGIDRYNADYAARHLAWRSSDALLALSDAPGTPEPTRVFVGRFVAADRVILRDGQEP